MVEVVKYKKSKKAKLEKFFKIGKYSFSHLEIKHLFGALSLIILTLLVFRSKNNGMFSLDIFLISITNYQTIIIYLVAIGFGFILHELGHKIVAQYYGFVSEFRADFTMVLFILGLSLFLPFIFLSPGAVMVLGNPTIRQNGIISVAGPVVNLIIAILSIILMFFVEPVSFFSNLLFITAWVNVILGIFNMLPFWILDGKKVIEWSKEVYFGVMGSLLILFYLLF